MPAWVAEVGVAASVAIAGTAVWGDRIRAAILRPRLRLDLNDPGSELTTQVITDAQGHLVSITPARYYHLRVTNTRHFPAAHEVQVYLTHIEMRGPDGSAQTRYRNAIPLTWMHPQLYPDRFRTIGHSTIAVADLFFVRPDRLQLSPVLAPNNLPDTFQPDAHFWITLIARGIDAESNELRLRIDWDGQWDRGELEMGRHLTIAEDPAPRR